MLLVVLAATSHALRFGQSDLDKQWMQWLVDPPAASRTAAANLTARAGSPGVAAWFRPGPRSRAVRDWPSTRCWGSR